MATVVVTLKIMPESTDTSLKELSSAAEERIRDFGGSVGKSETHPIAFGLKYVSIMFALPEEKGGTEELEKQIAGIRGVRSVQVTDVRRAIG